MLPNNTLLQERYRIIEHIGSGGMGSVYKAEDIRLYATVALKQTLIENEQLREAFSREAQLLASLRHPAIPRVSDHFVAAQGQFLVMEYIPGQDLGGMMEQRRKRFELADVLRWADQLLAALEYLHTLQPPIVHRDIKPQNLKLTAANDIILLDFGLAKGAIIQAQAAAAASIFGYTPHYAPLEQIHGTGTDARSDLYALAATLYHLLTGQIPVDAASRAAAVINGEPDPLIMANDINPSLPSTIAEVIHEAMSQRASLRPPSATAFRLALQQAQHEGVDGAEMVFASAASSSSHYATIGRATTPLTQPTVLERPEREHKRRWLPFAIAPVVVLAGTLGFFALRGAGTNSADTSQPGAGVAIRTTTATAPQQMNGSLNIAVAEFVPLAQGQCQVKPDEAQGISSVVYRTLSEQVQSAFGSVSSGQTQTLTPDDVVIMPPDQTGSITGTTAAEQQESARQKAIATNADVVLYGAVACEDAPRQTHLTPQIYLSDRKLVSFEQLEFIGTHEFGSQLSSAGTPDSTSARSELAEQLTPRANLLVQFLFGLDDYYAGNYEKATAAFQAAADVKTDDTPFLTAIVSLFQGTTAARLQDFVQAQQYYQAALAVDPTNVRARYSVGESLYYSSRGNCTVDTQHSDSKKTDVSGIQQAIQQFLELEIDTSTPYGRAMRGLAALHLGLSYQCLAQTVTDDVSRRQEYLSEADGHFKEAIQSFDADAPWIKDHIAEANEGRALNIIYDDFAQRNADPQAADTRLRNAGQYLCQASQLSGFASRQVEFRHWMGWIYGQLGEFEQAEIERQAAIKIDAQSEEQWRSIHDGWKANWATVGSSKPPSWTCQTAGATNP